MKLIDEDILEITPSSEMNGAGPKGFGWLVPDQLGLVNVEKAANIHDALYWAISLDTEFHWACMLRPTRAYADKIFYRNLQIINKEQSPTRIGYYLRKPVIWLYYHAVRMFGGSFIK